MNYSPLQPRGPASASLTTSSSFPPQDLGPCCSFHLKFFSTFPWRVFTDPQSQVKVGALSQGTPFTCDQGRCSTLSSSGDRGPHEGTREGALFSCSLLRAQDLVGAWPCVFTALIMAILCLWTWHLTHPVSPLLPSFTQQGLSWRDPRLKGGS